MRNQEAARYARWAAIAAGAIALAALGLYAQHAIRVARTHNLHPAVISATVQQQSAQFSFSKVEQDRTIFTVRASQATQFKDQDRAVLKDVWISIYGMKGERNDNIHTRECSYEPKSGDVRCEGDVEIDIQAAGAAANVPASAAGNSAEKQIKVMTRDLYFNRETGEAHTDQPVNYELPEGKGRAVGVVYSTKDESVRLLHDVELEVAPSERTAGMPVTARGTSLDLRRNDWLVILNGPAKVTEGGRELTAGMISFELDSDYKVKHAIASGNPAIHSSENGANFEVTADQFEGYLSPAGWIEKIAAQGNVQGTRTAAGATDHFSAAMVNLAMLPQRNLIQEMTADGHVRLESHGPDGDRKLETESLRADFSAAPAGKTRAGEKAAASAGAEQQKIVSAETLSPATIETASGTEKTTLAADRFQAGFGADGKFDKLLGHSRVRITRQLGTALPQTTTADEMAAEFGKNGEWETLAQTGNVRFQQGDRSATAGRARIVRSAQTIDLEGAPALGDAQSRTTAQKVLINQKTGDIQATGGVVTTVDDSSQDSPMGLGTGPGHISAQTLSGSTTTGHVLYAGHARLWQGESVLNADQIEIWREEQRLRASGNVAAVFEQAPGPATLPSGSNANGGSIQSVAQKTPGSPGPTLWNIAAPVLTYWGEEGKAHLEGGVTARSDQGTIRAKVMDVYFTPAGSPSSGPDGKPGGAGSLGNQTRQFTRAVATGGVVVTQGDRRGAGESAEYTAADGKFVLSGGKPVVSDGSGNTTTGRSLTFFVSNDTILIDSQAGSRTLTKHRVEK